MARKIILLSDGTGNSSSTLWRTNVWRVFESIDLSESDQIAFYDDGVGTASFKPIALLGGAFGYGLKRNVIDLYKFACRNFRSPDDEIFGFGFSRGAFTMRVVIGLILDQGLVQASSEPELHRKATQAYRAFRGHFRTVWPEPLRPERWGRVIRDAFLHDDYNKEENRQDARVRFLGLWDTVAAYGLPVDEMTRGVSRFIWPLMLPNTVLNERVQRACHALSIDDERTTFHPVLWDERNETPLEPNQDGKRLLSQERISQVWFAGMHANVGGGYPDDSLAHVPLTWVVDEAQRAGLRFKTIPEANPQTAGHPKTVRDRDGRIYDPRSGVGGYYRYGPRDLIALCENLIKRKGAAVAYPRIHETVLKRIANHAHAYAPIGLPHRYEVVTDGGEVMPAAANPFETAEQAQARFHEQQRVWNVVWWRRGVYFMTVIVSLYLFALPLMRDRAIEDEWSSAVGWISNAWAFLRQILPSAADPWISVYAQNPITFAIATILLIVLLKISARLAANIQTHMETVWLACLNGICPDPGPAKDLLFRIRSSRWYICGHRWIKNAFAPAVFAALFIYLGLAFVSQVAFEAQNYAGLICRSTGTKAELASGEFVLASGATLSLAEWTAKAAKDPAVPLEDKNNPFKYLAHYGVKLPEFHPDDPCQSMRILVERPGVYRIRFESTDSFSDFDGALAAPYGYFNSKVVTQERKVKENGKPKRDANGDPEIEIFPQSQLTLRQQLMNFASTPFRRELAHPWLRVVARVGDTGNDEQVLEPDPFEETYKINTLLSVRHRGELFLFVNDAVLGLPFGFFGSAYQNNGGGTRVLILRQ